MPSFHSNQLPLRADSATIEQRQQVVATLVRLAAGTTLEVGDYELLLLEQYVQGELSMENLVAHLETGWHKR